MTEATLKKDPVDSKFYIEIPEKYIKDSTLVVGEKYRVDLYPLHNEIENAQARI